MKKQSTLRCPACGSADVKAREEPRTLTVPYGSPISFEAVEHTCTVCGESGDFDKTNDERINVALATAGKRSVTEMLEHLADHGTTMAYVERSLQLPQRTLARWKAGEFSASSIALLKLVRTYPWLLEVADSGFDPVYASLRVVQEAGRVLTTLLGQTVRAAEISVLHDPTKLQVHVECHFLNDSLSFSPPPLQAQFQQLRLEQANASY